MGDVLVDKVDKKVITVVVPTYNEQENIPLVYDRIKRVFSDDLPGYNWELLFIDNFSTDGSRAIITELAEKDDRIKAIFNARNFGFSRSTYYGLSQAAGDCAVLMYADMQDPPEVIPQFVREWEQGKKIVVGIKRQSRENKLMFLIRKLYYFLLKKICDIEHIEQYNGFGLYDRSFIAVLQELDDPQPYLRGIVAELGFRRGEVIYDQEKREHGKSSFNFLKLYDVAMQGITSYSKLILRLATLLGFGVAIVSLIIAGYTFIYKLLHWDTFPIGNAAISIGVFFLGAVQLFFIGFLGEYVMSINARTMRHPLVIEEKRINFDEKQEKV